MKLYLIIINFCFVLTAIGQRAPEGSPTIPFEQQKKIWLENIEHQKYNSFDLTPENLKTEFLHYDFSTLFIPKQEFLGIIGTDYQRIKICFTSINKNSANEAQYDVKGISVVKNNKCDFKGTVRISQIRKYKQVQMGVDSSWKDAQLKAEGILVGDYEFKEDSAKVHSGIFSGIMMLFWYVDKFGILHFDDIESSVSDGYCNDLYAGTWKDYRTVETKVCNWGMYRIPFSGDLDIGAAEFSPDKKYKEKGWADLMIE